MTKYYPPYTDNTYTTQAPDVIFALVRIEELNQWPIDSKT